MQINKDAQRGPSPAPSAPSSTGRTSSYLGPDLQIKGEITGHEDLKVDSKVEGAISIGGFRLTVGPRAHVVADIIAREAMISGEVTGDISACDRIEIMKTATIVGELKTGKIMIEEGAHFKGGVEVGSSSPQIGTDLDSLLRTAKKAEVK
jgi:cytoskeletal protein CcmA (bactofilin family)